MWRPFGPISSIFGLLACGTTYTVPGPGTPVTISMSGVQSLGVAKRPKMVTKGNEKGVVEHAKGHFWEERFLNQVWTYFGPIFGCTRGQPHDAPCGRETPDLEQRETPNMLLQRPTACGGLWNPNGGFRFFLAK